MKYKMATQELCYASAEREAHLLLQLLDVLDQLLPARLSMQEVEQISEPQTPSCNTTHPPALTDTYRALQGSNGPAGLSVEYT